MNARKSTKITLDAFYAASHRALRELKNPSIGRIRCLTRRWSCSTRLFKYWLDRTITLLESSPVSSGVGKRPCRNCGVRRLPLDPIADTHCSKADPTSPLPPVCTRAYLRNERTKPKQRGPLARRMSSLVSCDSKPKRLMDCGDRRRPVVISARPWAEKFLNDITPVGTRQRVPWNIRTFWALFSLVCIWGALFSLTWAHWGDLTIDSGREIYVAAELAQGRTLYSDLWYPYTPGSPYVNAVLFRLFGFRLGVLYCAGALAALGSAVFLFLTGLQLVSRMAAWTTGTVLLIQSFVPGIFSFPLPFSFAAVYGCLSACIYLWLIVNACSTLRPGWMFSAGITASIALLMKQEIGAACFTTLALLVIIHGIKQRSFLRVTTDLAVLLPGCLLAIGVIYWMISLRGADFLTQENLMSWPTSYFMRTYGAHWLSMTGLAISKVVVFKGVVSISVLIVFWLGLRWLLVRYRNREWMLWSGLLALTALLILGLHYEFPSRGARVLAFPPAAPFLVTVTIPVAAWLCWRTRLATGFVQALMLFSLASCISLRILFRMQPVAYAIYYDGPVLLSNFLILTWFLDWKAPGLTSSNRGAAIIPYVATLVAVSLSVLPLYKQNRQTAPLRTERGVIYAMPQKVQAYRSVLEFIQHQPPSASFLSIPEDVSLYFLAGIHCPTRVYAFTPGVLAPGKMTAGVIEEIERKKVGYLIWSNRTFEEYGVPKFGVDFDRALGEYFAKAYRPVRTIGGETSGGWNAVIWERITGEHSHAVPASTTVSTTATLAR